ncbi:DUF4351 domain-containing protein [Haliangium sp.]|uniref:DUF4351 domain-containing protein n=1 Tax=Haliangium sp. TaxID=2663208 RepID=UPI003D118A33
MPSISHESLVELFRDNPALGTTLLRRATDGALPEDVSARVTSTQFRDLQPPEYTADVAYLLETPEAELAGAVVVEVQLERKRKKRASWLKYVATLHAKLDLPATLMVVAINEDVARWCCTPHVYDLAGNHHQPIVIGPDLIPWVTDIDEAKRLPELAMLSVAAHGREDGAEQIGLAARAACEGLDTDRACLYADFIELWLSEAARQAMETLMLQNYQYQSEFALGYVRQGEAQGRKEMLIELLEERFGALPEAVVERVQAAETEQLKAWSKRVLAAASLDEVFVDAVG